MMLARASVRSLISIADGFVWSDLLGCGYHPLRADARRIYDQEYFANFDRNARTELGRALMQARFNFVDQHFRNGALIDVGIGSGAFIELRRRRHRTTYGYDINPAGIRWLERRMLFADPYLISFDAMTLWDVLEHIPDFHPLLANVREWLFLSLPIFRDREHACTSKHFKPDEHCWYFTRDGLVAAMKMCGFALITENAIETELGREDIGTFAFRRLSE